MQPLVSAVKGCQEQDIRLDLRRILPVFLPASLVESSSWTGPFDSLPAPGMALAWAVPHGDVLRYLSRDTRRQWETRGIDWRTQALQNLRDLSAEPLGTGALFRETGETWLISLMYPDGLGPSRLLLSDELARIFPNGYRVALPERNRAFAFARDLDHEDTDTVENLVERSYSNSERPLSSGIFEPADLLAVLKTGL